MLQTQCILKIRDNRNTIIKYRLLDNQGFVHEILSDELKNQLYNNTIDVRNLQLTRNNKIIDRKCDIRINEKYVNFDNYIINIVNKSKLLGLEVKEKKTNYGYIIYIIRDKDNNVKVLIPSDVKVIDRCLLYIKANTLAIIGGHNVLSMNNLLRGAVINYLDMSRFITNNAEDISCMFANTCIKNINFSDINTSNVQRMAGTFMESQINELDLSKNNLNKVTNWSQIFYYSTIHKLNIGNLKLNNLMFMNSAFKHAAISQIDLSKIQVSGPIDANDSFALCKAKVIKLGGLDKISIINMENMFSSCEARVYTNNYKILKQLYTDKEQLLM